jgi:hypothetical protein
VEAGTALLAKSKLPGRKARFRPPAREASILCGGRLVHPFAFLPGFLDGQTVFFSARWVSGMNLAFSVRRQAAGPRACRSLVDLHHLTRRMAPREFGSVARGRMEQRYNGTGKSDATRASPVSTAEILDDLSKFLDFPCDFCMP